MELTWAKDPGLTLGFGLSSELLAEAAGARCAGATVTVDAMLGGVENFNGSGTGVS